VVFSPQKSVIEMDNFSETEGGAELKVKTEPAVLVVETDVTPANRIGDRTPVKSSTLMKAKHELLMAYSPSKSH
jgi:hypothetical protein